jgi:hypothetical protein
MALADVVKTLKKEQKKLMIELDRITGMIRAAGVGLQAGVREYGKRRRRARRKARVVGAFRKAGKLAGAARRAIRRKPMSAAARKRIAAAQRARWAKLKAAQKGL